MPHEQTTNAVLLSTLLGYISSKQNLIELLTGPAGTELPGEVAQFDLEAARTELTEIRFSTSRLAGINGDFQLAQLLLSGSGMPAERVTQAKEELSTARADLLRLQRRRISEALADVDAGLRREWRDPDAPDFDDYVSRLSNYRERQTVEMLSLELERLLARDVESWTNMQFDLARLVCRVLGNINQPTEAVPVLANLLKKTDRPELVQEAAHALSATASTEALPPLLDVRQRFGLDLWRELYPGLARLPMPARLREPASAQDWIDRSAMLLARGNVTGAEAAAARAINLDERSADALLQRALARLAQDDAAAADVDLTAALAIEPGHYEALLERGRLRNSGPVWEVISEDFDAAIKLQPDNWRGYHARAAVLARRFKLPEARADYTKALALQPHRIETYLEYGALLQSRADAQGAMAIFTDAVERWPDDWRTWSARAFLRRERGMGGAYEDARKAVELNDQDASSWDVLAQVHFAWSRFVDGIESATRAVESNPRQWLAWYYRGLHWHKWQEREDGQRRVATGDSGTRVPGSSEGGGREPMEEFLRARNERLTNAARDFGEALKIMPDDFRTSYLLAETLIQLERYDDAARVIDDALEINPFCYMRWGGFVIADMRHWQTALAWRNLADAEPKNDRERIGKAMFNAMAASASVYSIHAERQKKQLIEADSLLRQVAARWRTLSPGDLVLLCHTIDRTADALMAGGGREFYLDAQRLYELRPARFTDYGTDLRHARILVGLAAASRAGTAVSLNPDDLDFVDFRTADEMTRAELENTNVRLAFGVIQSAISNGLRMSDFGQLWRRGGFELLEEVEDYDALVEALNSPKPRVIEAGDSLYGESIVIVDVTEGAPAWLAGLRQFDRILELNGRPLIVTEDFFAAWTGIAEGKQVKMKVERFVMRNKQLVPVTDAAGKPVLDENGFMQWQTETLEFTVTRGFLGISLGMGMVPPRFAR
jgi:tetratricopeptide (TPR) repeat protein